MNAAMPTRVAALLAIMLSAGAAQPAAQPAALQPARQPPAKQHSAQQPAQPPLPADAARLDHGRFHDLIVYAPPQAPASFVLFLSGDAGWNAALQDQAQRLVQQGAMVTGIDLPKLQANLEADGSQCVFPDGDLENLSHFVQAFYHNSSYLAPILAGSAQGATMAYAALAQAPRDTFASALTTDFCPQLKLKKPLCAGSGVRSLPDPHENGATLQPIAALGNPWVEIRSPADRVCPVADARQFISQVRGAALAVLPMNSGDAALAAAFDAAFKKLAATEQLRRIAPAPPALGDLPVVEVPAQAGAPPSDAFAILMSGDGGWAGLDQDVAAALSAKGVPVVGLDSLRYYWTARTPDGVAADTDKLIRYYLAHFNKKRVLLVGYSQGADVLPFAVNRLPAATRANVSLAAILGMSEHALFEFHVSSWIADANSGPATLPEVDRISGIPVLCIYGEDEKDSLCPKLDPGKIKVVKVKGGHHFDGDYAGLARDIIDAARL